MGLKPQGLRAWPASSEVRILQATKPQPLKPLPMVIGVLQFELSIPHSLSLKDKRRVVKSLKDRLHREHMVAIAEVAALDEHQTAVMALSLVSNSAPHASEVMDRVVEKLKSLPEARLGKVAREMIHESELDWRDEADAESAAEWAEEDRVMAEEAERALRGGERAG